MEELSKKQKGLMAKDNSEVIVKVRGTIRGPDGDEIMQ